MNKSEAQVPEAATVPVGVVVVAYNSEAVLGRAIECLLSGTVVPQHVVVVDNGSKNAKYLDAIDQRSARITVVRLPTNRGFCGGNNVGIKLLGDRDHVLLLNPDAFVTRSFLQDAVVALAENPEVGALGPKLLGADATSGMPTGLLDSAGIGQNRWGRFFDRGMGEEDRGQFDHGIEDVPALCGAALLIRREGLDAIAPGGSLFDERFFMYKEDLDVCFRLRRAGWRTVYDSDFTVFHCRGWDANRRAMPAWARRRSMVNEWRLWRHGWTPERSRWGAVPYLLAKTVAVGLGR